jgi:mannose-1-phosphate guanylyltransferase
MHQDLKARFAPRLPAAPVAAKSLRSGWSEAARRRRWGVILAGGDGVRLRSLTHFISGDDRPKQFCPIFHGGVSLLERTRQRMIRNVRSEQTLFAVTRAHQRFYVKDLAGLESQRIIQPANRGTTPPILHSLLSIARTDPAALVAITPCDHYFSDEALFAATIEAAFDLAAEQPESVVLLAARPSHAEVEYGWIETAPAAGGNEDLFRVRAFHEKPSADLAGALLRRGSLWNTFVMIGHVEAFLGMIRMARADLVAALSTARLWSGLEIHVDDSVYDNIAPADFSREVLAANAGRLIALRLGPMVWSDLGDPGRTLEALSGENSKPAWVRRWQVSRPASSFAVAAGAA